jgi:hypothetical protein
MRQDRQGSNPVLKWKLIAIAAQLEINYGQGQIISLQTRFHGMGCTAKLD